MAKQQMVANKMELDLDEVKEIIEHHFEDEVTSGDVLHLIGPPGIGKSSIIKQVQNRLGYDKTTVFMAAQRAREDLVGPPFLIQPEDPDNALKGREALGYTKFYPPKTLLRLTKQWDEEQKLRHEGKRARIKAEGGEDIGEYESPGPEILFLDEFANAQPDVQTVYHSLVLDRNFGDEEYELRDNVRIVAASNRPEDGAHVYKMSAPLATRVKHLYVRATMTGWLDWARQANVWEPIRAFIKNRETQLGLNGIDQKIKNEAQPTPRSWEKASNSCRMKAYTINPGDSKEAKARKSRQLQALLEGSIGAGAAVEFMKFLEYAREAPSADKINAEWDKLDTFDDQPDIALVAVENMISGVKRNPKYVTNFLKYSQRMHAQYRQILEPELMNINNTMSEDVLMEVLASGNFEKVAETAHRMNRVLEEGDNAGTRKRPRK